MQIIGLINLLRENENNIAVHCKLQILECDFDIYTSLISPDRRGYIYKNLFQTNIFSKCIS